MGNLAIQIRGFGHFPERLPREVPNGLQTLHALALRDAPGLYFPRRLVGRGRIAATGQGWPGTFFLSPIQTQLSVLFPQGFPRIINRAGHGVLARAWYILNFPSKSLTRHFK